jgi:hypothetical protein
VNEVHSSTPDDGVAPGRDPSDYYVDGQLRALGEKLQARGLEARLVTYPFDGIKGDHYDAVVVTNPAAPERGTMHIYSDGCLTWECHGRLDPVGISKTADEATNALRAMGVRYRPRQPS